MRSLTTLRASAVLALALLGCTPRAELPADAPDAVAEARSEPYALAVDHVIDSYIPEWLQIDYCPIECPGDANLFVGDDPADGTASFDKPEGGDTYVDWDDLDPALHRFLDLNDATGKDPTAFPLSNSCVGSAKVLAKMDLTYVGAANNDDWAYFVVQRASNSGDAAYYWLITRIAPEIATSPECKTGTSLMTYDLRGPDAATGATGDLLMVGHFHSSETQLRVFQAVGDVDDVEAKAALDYHDASLWTELTEGFAVAVNTTDTRAGTWGDAGVKDSDGVDLEPELIAELAVEMGLVVGDEVCGGQFYGSVVTRSSGSGDLSPDMKDLAGPFILQMQSLEGYARIEPTCDGTVVYDAGDLGGGEVRCDWVFDDGTTVTDSCAGEVAVTPGARTATVTLTGSASACVDEIVTAAVDVGEVLGVEANATATCDLAFEVDADVTGASGDLSWAWTITDGDGATIDTLDAASGRVEVGAAGAYGATVVVSDDRGGGLVCSASDTVDAEVLEVLAVDPALAGTCAETVGYDANVTGGGGGATVAWSFSDGSTSTAETGTLTLGDQPTGGTRIVGEVTATEVRPDGLVCEATGSDAAWVYSPVEVSLAPSATALECPALDGGGTADAVTWTAAIVGGTGVFTYDWTVDACDGAASCTVDPPDADLCALVDVRLVVGDAGVCDDATSETETYTKVTEVTATDR